MSFNPPNDIPDLSGKVIIVTGGSSGLGKESVHQLVKRNPAKVYLAARTSQRGNAAIEEIVKDVPSAKGKIHYLEVDMASFASVKRASDLILAENNRLDILMNNAGLADAPSGLTTDGYEIQFGTNYLGPTLFTKLLLPLLQETAKQPDSDKTGSVAKYGQSKLGNYFFTKVCAQEYPTIKSVALHPGIVNTGIWDNMFKRPYVGRAMALLLTPFLTNVHDGAKRQLWASTANKTEIKNGAFYTPKGSEYTQAILKNDQLANELWEWTEKEFAEHGF
ncbi:NAD(P)-binding protein, partial [Aureobasidium melanogenum]